MTLIVLWTLLGLFVGCLVGNAVNKNLCYQSVKKLLTNNLKHEMIVCRESNSLLFLSTVPSTSRDSYSERCNAFRHGLFSPHWIGYLKKSLFIH